MYLDISWILILDHAPESSLHKPKFYYADFHRNFPTAKVADTNHERRGRKLYRYVEMFATKSDKVRDKSATNPFVLTF